MRFSGRSVFSGDYAGVAQASPQHLRRCLLVLDHVMAELSDGVGSGKRLVTTGLINLPRFQIHPIMCIGREPLHLTSSHDQSPSFE